MPVHSRTLQYRSETLLRRLLALALTAGVVVTLSGCVGSSTMKPRVEPVVSCDSGTSAAAGTSSKLVSAPQGYGTAPVVSFPRPMIANQVEASVMSEGKGAMVENGQPVLVEATIVSGADGSVLQQTAYTKTGGSLFTLGDSALPELGKGLECQRVGSRVAVVAPAAKATKSTAPAATVFVIDLVQAFKARADGADQIPQNDMPAVVTAPDGTPGITLPNQKAPTDFRKALLKAGTGKKVTASSNVIVKYTAVDWDAKTANDSTWSTGSAAILSLADTSKVSTGLAKALEGQRVGSQVIAVLPPGVSGVGGVKGTGTLVYVVDILGTIG